MVGQDMESERRRKKSHHCLLEKFWGILSFLPSHTLKSFSQHERSSMFSLGILLFVFDFPGSLLLHLHFQFCDFIEFLFVYPCSSLCIFFLGLFFFFLFSYFVPFFVVDDDVLFYYILFYYDILDVCLVSKEIL